jgi:O-antigen/teichoic acid export membrane protein
MPTSDNKRIAKNTIMLYFRMLLTMLVSLYTSRIILNTLGVEDYGIYNVVGGVIAMISVLNASMGAATSRFLIFELGKKDYPQLKKVFNATLVSHIGIALIVLLLAETVGLWFITNKLVIPEGRMEAALWAYQFSVLSTMVSLTQVPYNSLIIAHERMNVYAYVSILGVFLKLVIVYLLQIGNYDKLKLYSTLFFLATLVIALIYRFYCRKKFPESSVSFKWDKKLYKELFSFSAWELYSGFAGIGVGQGLNMVLNIFFGPSVNAANGIASTVQGQISGFGTNFMVAVKPQIVKLYADNKVTQMMSLVFLSSKYSLFLTLFLTLPLLLEIQFVLELWLKTVPDYTISFCRLVLVGNLISSLQGPIGTCFHALGKLKMPSLVGGTIYYLIIIVSYYFLKTGYPPESVFVITIVVKTIVQFTELILLKRFIKYSIRAYFREVIWSGSLVVLISGTIPYLLTTVLDPGFIRFLVVGFTCVITIVTMVYFIGLDHEVRDLVIRKIKTTIQKLKRKNPNGYFLKP